MIAFIVVVAVAFVTIPIGCGYIAACVNTDKYLLTSTIAGLTLASVVLALIYVYNDYKLVFEWYVLRDLLIIVALATFGGYLAKRYHK